MSSKISKIVTQSPAENHPVLLENFGTYLAHRQHDMKGLLVRDQSETHGATLPSGVGNLLMVTGERQLYYGRIEGQSEPGPLRTYVARRNRTTGKMRLVEVQSCKLTHVSLAEKRSADDADEPDQEMEMRRRIKLQQKFNARAGRTAMNRWNQRPDLTTMDEKLNTVLTETVVKQPQNELETGDDNATSGTGAADDLQQELKALAEPDAKSLANLYKPMKVIGMPIWTSLTKPATALLQQPAEDLKMENTYLEMKVKAAMQSLREGESPSEADLAVVRTCIYMDVLARLFSKHAHGIMQGNENASPFTDALNNTIRRSFLQSVRTVSGNRNLVTNHTRSKALMHYMALVFALEAQPTLQLGMLHRATMVKRQDLLLYGRTVGAQYVSREDIFRIAPVKVSQDSNQSERVMNVLAALKASFGIGNQKRK